MSAEWHELPHEIQEKMLEWQLEQAGKMNPAIFEKTICNGKLSGGFDWDKTPEGSLLWNSIIRYKEFDIFYTIYPKNPIKFEYHREFKKMFRVNKIPKSLSEEMLKVLEEKNVHKEWINV